MSPVTASLSIKEVHYYRSALIMKKYPSVAEAVEEEGQGRPRGRGENRVGRRSSVSLRWGGE